MNILFIIEAEQYYSPEKPLETPDGVRLGISYISALLKSHGHQTDLLLLTRETPRSLIDTTIDKFKPKVIGFTAVASEYEGVSQVARYIKQKRPDLFLLAGGPHVTLNPTEAIQGSFDAICVGEGEFPTLELVQQLDQGQEPTTIENLWIKRNGDVEKNNTRKFIADLDIFPPPDRNMWHPWVLRPDSEWAILLGRGCPYRCTYCCNHALKRVSKGPYVRFRSPENIVSEVRTLLEEKPNTNHIYFEVETIGIKTDFAIALGKCLEEFNRECDNPPTYGVNLRITPGKDFTSLFEAFKKANFSSVNLGLESGSERVRKEILLRTYGNDDVIRSVKQAKAHGLSVNLTAMIGFPGETLAEFRETTACTRACQPEVVRLSVFTPYPGTDLYTKCKEMDLIEPDISFGTERQSAVLDLPGFTKKQIQREHTWFNYNVYKGHKPTAYLLYTTFMRWIISKPQMNHALGVFKRSPLWRTAKKILKRG